jgi:hypothetical protein
MRLSKVVWAAVVAGVITSIDVTLVNAQEVTPARPAVAEPQRIDRPGDRRPDRPERPERADRRDRSERPDRPERRDRPEHPGRVADKPVRPESVARR